MSNSQLLLSLYDAKAHIGHKKSRIHPKSQKNIYTMDNGISIIDLTKTEEQLNAAKKFIAKCKEEGKVLMVVATKKVASVSVTALSIEHGATYITTKWPSGLLTNFKSIVNNIKKMNTMQADKASGAWDKFVKHEQMALAKQLVRLERIYGGIKDLKKIPDVLFIVDAKKEANAVKEARECGIPTVAIMDTNVDPTKVDYPIAANDDAGSSVDLICKEVLSAYLA
jgi:small subunit ribosomal protein S2